MKWYKYDIRDFTDSEYNKWYSLMSADKKQHADRFRYTDDKKRTVVGEMLVRKAVAEWCNVPIESIIIDKSIHGKPFVKDLSVEFNISHSGDIVVCAVDKTPVGIDIEQVRNVDLKIAKRMFTDEELIYVFGCKPCEADFNRPAENEELIRFFEVWTAMEAYAKYTGKGISGIRERCNMPKQTVFFNDYIITIVTEE